MGSASVLMASVKAKISGISLIDAQICFALIARLARLGIAAGHEELLDSNEAADWVTVM